MRAHILAGLLAIGFSTTAQDNVPPRFEEADTNGNGYIEVMEVQSMIDGFFIGKHDHGVMYIHNLIDFFFDQENIPGETD